MTKRNSQDPNFKNLIWDFPVETLRWLFPEAEEIYGKIIKAEPLVQEMKKHWLLDKGAILDIPLKFTFEKSR